MIVENLTYRDQTRLGKLTPKADQKRYASAFAVREGNAPSGWETEGSMADGIEFGERGEKKIQYHRPPGAPNEVDFHGIKLVEVVTPRKDAETKERIEQSVSIARTRAVEQARNEHPAEGIGITAQIETQIIQQPEQLAEYETTRPAKPAKEHHATRAKRLRQEAAALAAQQPTPTT